jgi:hypothetical protein
MAGKSDTHEFDWTRLTFNGVAANTMASLASTAGTTTLWMAGFSQDPTDAAALTGEGGYAAYVRVATQRSTAGWAITSGTSAAVASVSPSAAISFPQVATTSTGTWTHAVIFTSSTIGSSGALYVGTLTPNISFGQNTTPQITTASSVTED